MATEAIIEPHIFQILVLAINGLGYLALVLFGIILKGSKETQKEMNNSLREMASSLHSLNNLVLQHYVTKSEFDRLELYIRKEVHRLRDVLQYHEVTLNLLARHSKMEMPPKHDL